MNLKRKMVSLFAVLLLVCAYFPAAAFADYVYTYESDIVYNPAVVSYYWGWDKDWSVPYLTLSNGWHCSETDTQNLTGTVHQADGCSGKEI